MSARYPLHIEPILILAWIVSTQESGNFIDALLKLRTQKLEYFYRIYVGYVILMATVGRTITLIILQVLPVVMHKIILMYLAPKVFN